MIGSISNEWSWLSIFTVFDQNRKTLIASIGPSMRNSAAVGFKLEEVPKELKLGHNYLIKLSTADQTSEIVLNTKLVKSSNNYVEFIYLNLLEQCFQKPLSTPEDFYYEFSENASKAQAWIVHPWFISHKIFFSITRIYEKGLELRYTLDEKSCLLPGMKIKLNITIPISGSLMVPCTITHASSEGEIFYTRVTFNKVPSKLRTYLGQFILLTEPNIEPTELKKLKLPLPDFRYFARAGLVTDEDELEGCLRLRKDAYTSKRNNKFNSEKTATDFKDNFDNHSAIIKVSLGSKIIGTGRVVYNNGNKENSEIASLVDIPQKYWNEGFVEVSRFATDSKLRGKDIFLMMLYMAFKLSIQAQYRYILADCEDHLLPVYQRFGAVNLNKPITHPMENIQLHLVEFDANRIIKGKGINKIFWFLFITPLLDHLYRISAIESSPLRRKVVGLGAKVNSETKDIIVKKVKKIFS